MSCLRRINASLRHGPLTNCALLPRESKQLAEASAVRHLANNYRVFSSLNRCFVRLGCQFDWPVTSPRLKKKLPNERRLSP